ncbi:MAG TPA: protein kinase, partial [Gemmataceae bacterium]|nr:protein kinase [Gemmataceae bacterium]
GVERVKLTDFGLARAADDARLTQSGVAAGTPLYMSPEQARGETVDHRSDLFSLGSVLYTLATGFPPFRAGSTMGVLNRITNDAPRPIRETIPDFPPALEAIIMQLLEKDPQKRFQLGADVSFRLTAFLSRPPSEPATVVAAADESQPPAEEPVKWWVAALCLLAAAAMIAIVLTFRTSKGTLVVEVDDPAIKVALDGEELTITGAGPQEVRLKPGAYHVTATKDGKPAKVSQEIVKIEKAGKQTVKVWFEPSALPSPVPYEGKKPKSAAADADALLEERMKAVLKDPEPARLNLMRLALKASRSKATIGLVQGEPPNPLTHGLFPHLQGLVVEAASVDIPTDRIRPHLENAYLLAGTILSETTKSATANTSPGYIIIPPGNAGEGPEQRQKKLVSEFRALVARLVKTEAGRVLLTTGPGRDRDSALLGLSWEDVIRAKHLLTLRDEFGQLVPKAQKELDRWEKAGLTLADREIRFQVGQISQNEYEAAKLEVKQAERALRTAEDSMSAIIGDLKKLADELRAPAADAPDLDPLETELKKVLAEYDALVLRLAKTEVGRLLATISADRTMPESDIQATFGKDEKKIDQARRLLKLRGQITAQERTARTSLNERNNRRESKQKAKKEDLIPNIDEEIRKNEQDVRVRTAAIHSLVEDFLKLADEIDPPAKKNAPDDGEAEFKKVMAEYDALVVRLAKHPVGRAIVVIAKEWNEAGLQARGFAQPDLPKSVKLLNLRDEIRTQAEQAKVTIDGLAQNRETKAKNPGPDSQAALDDSIRKQLLDLKVRTEAIRGLVADLKKLADEIDPTKSDTTAAEFKKVMAEYDALALRVAKTPVGRLLATFSPDKQWSETELQNTLGPDDKTRIAQGRKLLNLRGQIMTQAKAADNAVIDSVWEQNRKATRQAGQGDKADLPSIEEGLHKAEQEIQLRTAALRGIVDDFKKLADELDPPAKKDADLPTEPKAKLQYFRDLLQSLENDDKEIAELTRRRDAEETGLKNKEAELRTTPAGKAADDLKDKIETARKAVRKLNDDLESAKAHFTRNGKKADLQAQIDQLQKEIDAKK